MKIEMDIPLNAEVVCMDGEVGKSVELVIDPPEQILTHVVVKEKKAPHEERLVPVEKIAGASARLIRLNCTRADFGKFDIYCQKDIYVESQNLSVYDSVGHSYVFPVKKQVITEHKSVPKDELPLVPKARIEAKDGHIGQLDELLIDPETDHITHLVLREKHLWGGKEVTVPISDIDRIAEQVIHLKLSKAEVKALPEIPIRR